MIYGTRGYRTHVSRTIQFRTECWATVYKIVAASILFLKIRNGFIDRCKHIHTRSEKVEVFQTVATQNGCHD